MLLKAALNGNRKLQEHLNIPVSPEQLATDAQAAVLRGVGAIHIHPRDQEGVESLKKSDIEVVVSAIRMRCPNIPIGVSTGEWKYISEWDGIIDFASVNFSEPGAAEVSDRLLELGIGVEAGLFHADAAQKLVESGLAKKCLRIMFEPIAETIGNALKSLHDMENILSLNQIKGKARLLHGFNSTAWPLLAKAKELGYDSRIGLEDTLCLPNQTKAENNAELIDAAQKILNEE
jgi:uncharacterized protein (DUF849 family)